MQFGRYLNSGFLINYVIVISCVRVFLGLPNPTISKVEIDGTVLTTYEELFVHVPNGTTINNVSCSVSGEYGPELVLYSIEQSRLASLVSSISEPKYQTG